MSSQEWLNRQMWVRAKREELTNAEVALAQITDRLQNLRQAAIFGRYDARDFDQTLNSYRQAGIRVAKLKQELERVIINEPSLSEASEAPALSANQSRDERSRSPQDVIVAKQVELAEAESLVGNLLADKQRLEKWIAARKLEPYAAQSVAQDYEDVVERVTTLKTELATLENSLAQMLTRPQDEQLLTTLGIERDSTFYRHLQFARWLIANGKLGDHILAFGSDQDVPC